MLYILLVYVLINVIEQSYSLIYAIPERILRWIGGPQEQSGIGQLSEQVKGETQQAAGQAAQGAGQVTGGANLEAQASSPTISSGSSESQEDTEEDDDGSKAS